MVATRMGCNEHNQSTKAGCSGSLGATSARSKLERSDFVRSLRVGNLLVASPTVLVGSIEGQSHLSVPCTNSYIRPRLPTIRKNMFHIGSDTLCVATQKSGDTLAAPLPIPLPPPAKHQGEGLYAPRLLVLLTMRANE